MINCTDQLNRELEQYSKWVTWKHQTFFSLFCVCFTYSNILACVNEKSCRTAFDFDKSRSIPPGGEKKEEKKEKGTLVSSPFEACAAHRSESSCAGTDRNQVARRVEVEPSRAESSRIESRVASRRAGWKHVASYCPSLMRVGLCSIDRCSDSSCSACLHPAYTHISKITYSGDHLYSFIVQFKDLQQPPLLSIIFVPSM